ncbi:MULTISPECIES: hypothetical protein [unclassified Actinoplanes]|uniref:hypothetical protein n=1 Tax=unclassified Actinoplanes TaxID=2626549 RepID=UPI0012BAF581|nr:MULTISPECIES: hypothetical protein [unclassified Actinoplanes]
MAPIDGGGLPVRGPQERIDALIAAVVGAGSRGAARPTGETPSVHRAADRRAGGQCRPDPDLPDRGVPDAAPPRHHRRMTMRPAITRAALVLAVPA